MFEPTTENVGSRRVELEVLDMLGLMTLTVKPR